MIIEVAAGQTSTAIQERTRSGIWGTRKLTVLPVVKQNSIEVSTLTVAREVIARPCVRMDTLEAEARCLIFKDASLGCTDEQAQTEAARRPQCKICNAYPSSETNAQRRS